MCGIYKIKNQITDKIYVGQSINIMKRWTEHKSKAFLVNEREYNSILHNSMRKHGISNFIIEIIEECDENQLDERERFWISELNSLCPNGYNILIGGQNNRIIANRCVDCNTIINKESTRCINCYAIFQRKVKERPQPLELAKMVKELGFEKTGNLYGVHGNAIKKWCQGYNIPYLKQELINWYNEQTNTVDIIKVKKQIRQVAQINKDTNEIIQIFISAREAAKSIGKSNSHIVEVCNGKHKTAYGYKWKYICEE